MKTTGLILACCALVLSACAGSPRVTGGNGVTLIDAKELPPPVDPSGNLDVRRFRVGGFDELLVDVMGFEELHDRKITTDSEGRFAIPLAGTIDAKGKTLDEIQYEIARRLREKFVRNPVVSVNVIRANSRLVTVDGQVQMPGNYPVLGRSTLTQAVASARGLTEYAKQQDVVVFRTVGEQRMVALFNLEAIRRGSYPDPEIFAGDTVVVGESRGRRLFQAFLQASPLLISPLVAILQNSGGSGN